MTSQYKNYKLFVDVDLKLPHDESEMSYYGGVTTGIEINMYFNDEVSDITITNTNGGQSMSLSLDLEDMLQDPLLRYLIMEAH